VRILGIETSCDETAAAVVEDGRRVISSVVSSQIELHVPFGGVVPEIAGRAHVQRMNPVIREALELAVSDRRGIGIDAVACTVGPGLIGALLIGVSGAKALASAWGVPFLAVNHLEAHLLSPFLEHPDLQLPVVTLLASGGHTLLVLVESATCYRVLGGTIDDAAGEAYDKVARYLGLGYPGGPAIDRLSPQGNPAAIAFPRAMKNDGYDFSFSGLKTSVVNHIRRNPSLETADVAASFQEAVVDVLVIKAKRAAIEFNAAGLCIGGGVAANSLLRTRIGATASDLGIQAYIPPRDMCTDNAAMVASAAWWRRKVDGPASLALAANPNLRLKTSS
jgi:N6-L-threonylcarbamoyladenine synthase